MQPEDYKFTVVFCLRRIFFQRKKRKADGGMNMICPRCGAETTAWPCPECGFPEIMRNRGIRADRKQVNCKTENKVKPRVGKERKL